MKTNKQISKILSNKIYIPIYYFTNTFDEGTLAEGIIRIDEDGMREEFERKLAEIIKIINN